MELDRRILPLSFYTALALRWQEPRLFLALQEDQGVLHVGVRISAAFGSRGHGWAEREKFEERRYVWRPRLVKLYDEAKTYIDGKWLTVAILSADDLDDVTEHLTMKRPPKQRD